MQKNSMAFNMTVLTFSGVVAKTIDFSMKAFYSRALGAVGMGIFSLIMGAYGIILSLSSAGVGAAVSRLVSLKVGSQETSEAQKIVKTAVLIVLSLGAVCLSGVLFFADGIAVMFLGDIRCTPGLLCITPAAVFMGVSYCIKGYFYGTRQVFIPASSEFVEQAVKIVAIIFFMEKGLGYGTEYGCAGVLLGLTVGELSSCIYLCLWYKIKTGTWKSEKSQVLAILKMTVPMTISAVGNSFFRVIEDIWIVRGFRRFGHNNAMEAYGMIHGMAMPLLIFPLTLVSSLMAIVVPEISRAEKDGKLSFVISRMWKTGIFFGFLVFAVFFLFAEEISLAIYGTRKPAEYIKPLSLLCPVMIIDSLSTGMLGGLGEQMKLLKYGLMDTALRLFIVYFILPVKGNSSIILMIFLSNFLTCGLTVNRIRKKSGLRLSAKRGVSPCLCALKTILISILVLPEGLSGIGLIMGIIITAGMYSLLSIKIKT